MPMVPLIKYCPEIARRETTIVVIKGDKKIPDGVYALLESFCDEPDCDCCRVFVNIVSKKNPVVILATISYGWESRGFYRKWFGYPLDKEILNDMATPILAVGCRQSELSDVLLDYYKEKVITDGAYVERLKRHYRLFKEALRKQTP